MVNLSSLLYNKTSHAQAAEDKCLAGNRFAGPENLACNWIAGVIISLGLSRAGVAELVEHLICNQRVGGSIPSASSTSLRLGE